MDNKKIIISDNSLYSIEKIDRLAIVKFKSDAQIKELYNIGNNSMYYEGDLKLISGSDISTRLFIFSENIFSEERFDDFFKTIKLDSTKNVDFLSLDSNIKKIELERFVNIKFRFISDILNSNQLNIMALEGSSIGLWLSTILSGDFSILSQNSQITFPFLKDDIMPLGGLVYYLDRYVGKAYLDEFLLLGKPISSDELFKWGLVNRVFSSKEFEKESVKLALEVSKKSNFYIKNIRSYKKHLKSGLLESLALERSFFS